MQPWYTRVLRANDPALRAEVKRAVMAQEGPRPQDQVGRVIEFLRGDRHLCGVVQPAPYGRRVLWVLDQEGREGWVRGRKVVDISAVKLAERSREGLVDQLRQIDRQRAAAQQALDMGTLWETVAESGQAVWSLDELAALYFGPQPGRDGRASLARALEEGQWFSRQESAYAPLSATVVAQHRCARARRQEAEERLEAGARWLRLVMDGLPATRPDHADELIGLLEEAALSGSEGPRATEAAALLQRAHLHGPLAAFEALVRLGHWHPDENLEMRRLQVPVPFSAAALAEAAGADWPAGIARCRRWWGRRVYGIEAEDGTCAWAFSLRRTWSGYKLGLHFPVPGLLLAPDGALQPEVAARGMALALPDRQVPLLPPAIVGKAALSTSERRPALTIEVQLSRRFAIEDYRVDLRRVRVRALLREGEPAANEGAWRWLAELAGRLRGTREAAGALVLPEAAASLRVLAGQVSLCPAQRGERAALVEEELRVLVES
ncbi:MAG: RNB domain-containing ribonuclease, partial [Candidatus Latescibacteria bacterium]|nr:RNB domain-containing ribonuclease [Candidatus Latescibacterota bacterium]